MPFNKEYFEKFSDHLSEYYRVYDCGQVTVTINTYDQEKYHVERIMGCNENLLTFTFYSKAKSRKLPSRAAERTREPEALPALTVPYEAILSVEFNPGRAGGMERLGFRADRPA